MTDQTRLDALLVRYEELRSQQPVISAEELCRDCPELLDELKQQIQALESLNVLLGAESEPPPNTTAEEADAAAAGPPAAEALSTGSRFRVLRLHARGGLGEVHVAQDEDLHREVALKRLQRLHARNSQSRGRFLWEAEITSRLEHPSIVPIHAVGQDDAGRPFYAMRFVRGETLQEAIQAFHQADKPGRDPGERRLALRSLVSRLVAVCNTVAYAHSRGILHRDIKPGNILLGPYGETLLVDWGLAKPMAGTSVELANAEALQPDAEVLGSTEAGAVIGTPAYMSPEQAEGRREHLGPASDVYSLGATLYVLLTGQAPFQGRHVGEVLDKVKHGDFVPPRQAKKDVPAALEAICLKAMAPKPEERYATGQALTADLEHWLADEPVGAWREPWSVRAGRWMRRHRTGVLAAVTALVVACLCLGGAAVLLLAAYREARQQRDAAHQQRDRADEHYQLAREAVDRSFTQISESPEFRAQGLEPLQRKLLQSAVEFYQRLVNLEGDDLKMQAEHGRAYNRLGHGCRLLEHNEQAEDAFQKARAIFANLAEAHPEEPSYRADLARNDFQLGRLFSATGRSDLAERTYQQARAVFAQLVEADAEEDLYQRELARCDHSLGRLYYDTKRRPLAEQAYLQALEARKRLLGRRPRAPGAHADLASSYNNLGLLYLATNDLDRAERAFKDNQDILRKLTDLKPLEPVYQQELATSFNNLALVYSKTNRMDQAEQAFRHARDVLQPLADAHPRVPDYQHDLATNLNNLAVVYRNTDRPDQALKAYREARALYRRLADAHPEVPRYTVRWGGCNWNIGHLLTDLGKPEETLEVYAQAIDPLEALLRKDSRQAAAREVLFNLLGGRAVALAKLGRGAEADKDLQRAAQLDEARDGQTMHIHGDSSIHFFRARVLAYRGQHAAAVAEAEAVPTDRLKARELCKLACVCSQALAAVQRESPLSQADRDRLSQHYGTKAVEFLRLAEKTGYFRAPGAVERLRKDVELNAVRSREDFKKLLNEVGATAPGRAP